jgi:hypothetical protein
MSIVLSAASACFRGCCAVHSCDIHPLFVSLWSWLPATRFESVGMGAEVFAAAQDYNVRGVVEQFYASALFRENGFRLDTEGASIIQAR